MTVRPGFISIKNQIIRKVFEQMSDEIDVQQLRQLGRQLLEEPAAVLTQLSEPLNHLRQSIENVKKNPTPRLYTSRLGSPLGNIIRENYDAERLDHFSDDANTNISGSSSSASQNSVEDDEVGLSSKNFLLLLF